MWATISFFLLSLAQQGVSPVTPSPAAHPVYVVEGRGVQIYDCGPQESKFVWVFRAPEAQLFDVATHEQVGTHGAGPEWTWKDGSVVTGRVREKTPSPDADSIPWLLLEATPGKAGSGALSAIAWIRRSETHGGNAPATGCDAQHVGQSIRVPYTATYSFYGSK